MCARTTFAEAESRVGLGELLPDDVHTPGVFVDYVMAAHTPDVIEKVVNR